MDRETNNRKIKKIPDLFDEALELEDVSISDPFQEEELIEAAETESAQPLGADPTFFDEQVINVPMIDPPDMKNISSYPDAQIYDQLVSLDDEDVYLQDEPLTDDIVPLFPEPEPEVMPRKMAVPEKVAVSSVSAKKPGKKPPVKRAGMTKEEPVAEPVAEPAEQPVRKKPRVKKAGEKAAAPAAAPPVMPRTKMIPEPEDVILPELEEAVLPELEEDILPELEDIVDTKEETLETAPAPKEGNPPIALMNVGSPRKTPAKKPGGKTSAPAKRPGGKTGGRGSSAKKPSSRPQRPKEAATAEEAGLTAAAEKKPAKKKLPFSPLEKMKQKLAQKWS